MKCKLSIQEKLKDLRIEKGLSLQELSEQTGISRAALGNYETDEYKEITHKAIITLANFYGVSADYLLGLTENRDHHQFPVDDILGTFEELKKADNSTQAQMVMYSKLFKINFTKMDPYEFKTFTDILQRYSDLCKPIKGNGRGKKKR